MQPLTSYPFVTLYSNLSKEQDTFQYCRTMEGYSSSYCSWPKSPAEESKQLKHGNYTSFKSHDSLLHLVRKQAKPWKKAPVAPPPPIPVKVFKVHPMNFRDLVQQLTGAPEFQQPQPQQYHPQSQAATANNSLNVAPAPVSMFSSRSDIRTTSPHETWLNKSSLSASWHQQDMEYRVPEVKSQGTAGEAMEPGLLELNLSSPSSSPYNLCAFPPMSCDYDRL